MLVASMILTKKRLSPSTNCTSAIKPPAAVIAMVPSCFR